MFANAVDGQHRLTLQRIAHRMMQVKGLTPDFPAEAISQLDEIHEPAVPTDDWTRDLLNLDWCSIDNDDSLNLDQLTIAKVMPGGVVQILVAIADVDAVVKKHSGIDEHAMRNTTSVYTVAEIFPMLPEKLSTDLTSLNDGSDRLDIVAEMAFDTDGKLKSSDRCSVRRRMKQA